MSDKRKDRVKEFKELFEQASPEDQADIVRRMKAQIAKQNGTATAEQLALVEDTHRRYAEGRRELGE